MSTASMMVPVEPAAFTGVMQSREIVGSVEMPAPTTYERVTMIEAPTGEELQITQQGQLLEYVPEDRQRVQCYFTGDGQPVQRGGEGDEVEQGQSVEKVVDDAQQVQYSDMAGGQPVECVGDGDHVAEGQLVDSVTEDMQPVQCYATADGQSEHAAPADGQTAEAGQEVHECIAVSGSVQCYVTDGPHVHAPITVSPDLFAKVAHGGKLEREEIDALLGAEDSEPVQADSVAVASDASAAETFGIEASVAEATAAGSGALGPNVAVKETLSKKVRSAKKGRAQACC